MVAAPATMQPIRKLHLGPARRASEPAPASDTMPTVRIAAMANLPALDGDEDDGTIHPRMTAASMSTGLNSARRDPIHDVVVPPSPRMPMLVRTRTTRAGRWDGHALAEWVKLHAKPEPELE